MLCLDSVRMNLLADTSPATKAGDHRYTVRSAGGIVTTNFNRPEHGNALNRAMMRGLAAEVRAAAADEQTRIIALEANGAYFCQGRDGQSETRRSLAPYDVGQQ